MSGPEPDPGRLQELEERLKKARGQREVPHEEAPPSKLGVAFRLVTELLAAVIVGGALGWGLDRVFGTAPILFFLLFFLGVAAGFFNVLRTAREMNESARPPDGPGAQGKG